MNRANVQRWALVLVLAALAGCGRAPTSPSPQASFLAGTWTGTLSIERENEPVASGSTTWTFAVVPDTNQQTFRVTIQSQHPWLPIIDHRDECPHTVQHAAHQHQYAGELHLATRMYREPPQCRNGDDHPH